MWMDDFCLNYGQTHKGDILLVNSFFNHIYDFNAKSCLSVNNLKFHSLKSIHVSHLVGIYMAQPCILYSYFLFF